MKEMKKCRYGCDKEFRSASRLSQHYRTDHHDQYLTDKNKAKEIVADFRKKNKSWGDCFNELAKAFPNFDSNVIKGLLKKYYIQAQFEKDHTQEEKPGEQKPPTPTSILNQGQLPNQSQPPTPTSTLNPTIPSTPNSTILNPNHLKEWEELAEKDPDQLVYKYKKEGLNFLKRYKLAKGLRDGKVSPSVIEHFLELWDNSELLRTDYYELGKAIDDFILHSLTGTANKETVRLVYKNICEIGKIYDHHKIFSEPSATKDEKSSTETFTEGYDTVLDILPTIQKKSPHSTALTLDQYRDELAWYKAENENLRKYISLLEGRVKTMRWHSEQKDTEQQNIVKFKPDVEFVHSHRDTEITELRKYFESLSEEVKKLRNGQEEEGKLRKEKEKEEILFHKMEDKLKPLESTINALQTSIASIKSSIPEWLKDFSPEQWLNFDRHNFEKEKWREEHELKKKRAEDFGKFLTTSGEMAGRAFFRVLTSSEGGQALSTHTIEGEKLISLSCPKCQTTIYAEKTAKIIKCPSCDSNWTWSTSYE